MPKESEIDDEVMSQEQFDKLYDAVMEHGHILNGREWEVVDEMRSDNGEEAEQCHEIMVGSQANLILKLTEKIELLEKEIGRNNP